MKNPLLDRAGACVLTIVLALFVTPSIAQQDARVSREREALRRSQAALKQAQEQQAALTREKSELVDEKAKREEALRRADLQLGGARSEAARQQARAVELAAQVESLRAEAALAKESAGHSADEAAGRLSAAERLVAERTQTATSLAVLLERSTKALAAAEEANRRMYDFGRDMIEQYRRATPPDMFAASDSVLGFAAVRRENRAEELRSQLEATRLGATPGP